jgi:hypothetical protein
LALTRQIALPSVFHILQQILFRRQGYFSDALQFSSASLVKLEIPEEALLHPFLELPVFLLF